MSNQNKDPFGDLFENLSKGLETIGKEAEKIGSEAMDMIGGLANKHTGSTNAEGNSSGVVGKDMPAINIIDEKDSLVLQVAAPGMQKTDFKVGIEEGALIVSSAGKAEEDTKTYKMREFNYQKFRRAFQIPESVDLTQIAGKYENGMLIITLGKKEEFIKKEPQNIEIW